MASEALEMMFWSATIEESTKWDNIVKSFNNYDAYYLSGYTRAFQLHGDGDPVLFFYEDKSIRALNVIMKRDIASAENFEGKIPRNSFYDATTPYGYGGFLIEGDIKEESAKNLEEAYSAYCRDNGIISEFARFHPVLSNSKEAALMYDINKLGRTVTLELKSQDQIWSDLTDKNRNVIRKAKKSGVEVYWGQSWELYKKFIPLYSTTMNKDCAKDYYYFDESFYQSILHDMKYSSLMFYAVYEETPIAMSIILLANQKMSYHLSTSDREFQRFAPTNLLLYEVACWGCENGFKTFHLGGGLGSQEDSLFKFKKAFNPNSETHFSIGKKIFDYEKYDALIDIRRQGQYFDENTAFFPKYRG